MRKIMLTGIILLILTVILAGCGSTKVVGETYEKKVETTREIVIE